MTTCWEPGCQRPAAMSDVLCAVCRDHADDRRDRLREMERRLQKPPTQVLVRGDMVDDARRVFGTTPLSVLVDESTPEMDIEAYESRLVGGVLVQSDEFLKEELESIDRQLGWNEDPQIRARLFDFRKVVRRLLTERDEPKADESAPFEMPEEQPRPVVYGARPWVA